MYSKGHGPMVDEKNPNLLFKERLLTPKILMEKMDKHVIGQQHAKKILAVSIYNHFKRIVNNYYCPERFKISKSNIIMLGPTGSGKTFLIESLCKELDIPFGIADATSLTESGYWGDDVESILVPLLLNSNMDVVKAAKGIVYIDEIDKIAIDKDRGRDVTGKGVQRSLLRIIEGKNTDVVTKHGPNRGTSDVKTIDTTNILFIVGGAFTGIEKIVDKRLGKREIGFNADFRGGSLIEQVIPEDLVTYGLMAEFVGRLPNIAQLNPLTVQDLTDILTKPENSIVNQYKNLFDHDQLFLEFDPAALEYIAQQALNEKTGARGLRAIMERSMLDIMFESPDRDNGIVVVTKERVETSLRR